MTFFKIYGLGALVVWGLFVTAYLFYSFNVLLKESFKYYRHFRNQIRDGSQIHRKIFHSFNSTTMWQHRFEIAYQDNRWRGFNSCFEDAYIAWLPSISWFWICVFFTLFWPAVLVFYPISMAILLMRKSFGKIDSYIKHLIIKKYLGLALTSPDEKIREMAEDIIKKKRKRK
jgi:hypothetical protein